MSMPQPHSLFLPYCHPAIREWRCHEGVYLVCNSVLVGGVCQVTPTGILGPTVSQQNIALNKMIHVTDFTCYMF